MSFRIDGPDGIAIPLLTLDKQAADFWSTKVDRKYYASPKKGINWFDSIGYNIHYNKAQQTARFDGKITWEMVKESMMHVHVNLLAEDVCEKIKSTRIYLLPYFRLIDHWDRLGYIPIKIKE